MTKTPRVHKVETKVTVSALLSLVAGVLLAFLGGYAAPHTDRPVIEVPAAGDDQ